MIEIKKISDNKDSFINLLLLGDESESMIKKYLYRGELFALYDNDDLKTVSVVTKEDNDTYEIKNIATYENCQRNGYGSCMVRYIIQNYKDRCKKIWVGTGESDEILSFYKNCGFTYSHTIKNFFTDNYSHKMYENGKQLIDMIYLKLEWSKQADKMKPEKINLNTMAAEQIGKLFPIRIVPYNPDWTTLFEQEKELIIRALCEDLVINIEHIGSTSVAGLAAKPTIDILVEVPELSDEVKQVITKNLGTIGYENMHHSEKEKKMTFGKGYDVNLVNTQTFHAHIREKGNVPQDEIYFRNYLRKNSDARDEYTKLKYALAEKHQFNREDYTQAKTEFIKNITNKQK